MSALEQVRALYEYNEWANNHVLDAAAKLTPEELARELGASFGSIQGNLWHAVGAQALWLSRWQATPPPKIRQLQEGRALEMIREAYAASHHDLRCFVPSVNDEALSGAVSYVDTQGNGQHRVLWQTMLHVANHGTHHRAETALLLTSLGRPPRQLDYVFFELERAGGAPRLT